MAAWVGCEIGWNQSDVKAFGANCSIFSSFFYMQILWVGAQKPTLLCAPDVLLNHLLMTLSDLKIE